jgi:hypothetical protein
MPSAATPSSFVTSTRSFAAGLVVLVAPVAGAGVEEVVDDAVDRCPLLLHAAANANANARNKSVVVIARSRTATP